MASRFTTSLLDPRFNRGDNILRRLLVHRLSSRTMSNTTAAAHRPIKKVLVANRGEFSFIYRVRSYTRSPVHAMGRFIFDRALVVRLFHLMKKVFSSNKQSNLMALTVYCHNNNQSMKIDPNEQAKSLFACSVLARNWESDRWLSTRSRTRCKCSDRKPMSPI